MIPAPRWRSRVEMIRVIAAKDLRAAWWHLLVAGIIAGVGGLFTGAVTAGSRMCEWNRGPWFVWNWQSIDTLYGLAVLATSLGVGLAFASFYGDELRRGTVRALILYPVDFNDITIAKLIAATVMGSLTATLAFLVPLAPMMASCLFPSAAGVIVIYGAALASTLFVVWTAAFLAHIVTYGTKRLGLTPSGFAALFLFLAILLTQNGANAIGSVLLNLFSGGRGVPWVTYQELWNVAGGIALLSPHHAAATLISGLIGPSAHFPDVYVVLPAGLLILAYGYLLGRKVPLDVFIK